MKNMKNSKDGMKTLGLLFVGVASVGSITYFLFSGSEFDINFRFHQIEKFLKLFFSAGGRTAFWG